MAEQPEAAGVHRHLLLVFWLIMKIVIAPDSFKESLSAPDVANAMARGVKLAAPDAHIVCIPMADGGHFAASLYNSLSEEQMAPTENHAFPRLPLPLDKLNGGLDVEPPPLIKGYLKLGAKICSAPAWDPDFNTADLLTMLRLSEINPRYAKHFLNI